MNLATVVAVAWVATAAAVAVTAYFTHSPYVVLAMLIPATIEIKQRGK